MGAKGYRVASGVDNWRLAHSYPMQVIRNNLARRAKSIDQHAIVAQRLKRFISIRAKLDREPRMKLSQMQDIGGCRAIVSSVAKVNELVSAHIEAWAKNPDRHELHRIKDYIHNPKTSGYRGVHIIYKFCSLQSARALHNGQRIEVQIRSRKQHIWATAVETVGTFTKEQLKSSQGSAEWQRLFALMASVYAKSENCPPIPNTPSGGELVGEIKSIAQQLRAEEFLLGCSTAAVNVGEKVPNAAAYVLMLDIERRVVNVSGFPSMTAAHERVAALEKENIGNPYLQPVLVSVDSIGELKRAYPNYYLDVQAFAQDLVKVVQ